MNRGTWAARLGGPLVLAAGAAALTAWSWRKWPDLLVDFGHELYLPWRLASGSVLHRDLATLYGPLSQYVNAALFALFGVSLTTLVAANLVLLAAFSALLYGLLSRECDRITAFAAVSLFLGVFAFSHNSGIGNYNFVCPYSHEATHGTMLGVVVVAALARAARRPGAAAPWLLAGVALGLSLLTRVETAVAALAAAGTALVLHSMTRSLRSVRPVLAMAAGALLPPAAAFALFCTALPAAAALRATLGAFTALFGTSVARLPFFRSLMGIDHPAENAAAMLASFAVLVLVAAAAAVLDFAATRRGIGAGARAVAGVALFVVLVSFPALTPFPRIWHALPLVVLAAGAGTLAALRRHPDRTPFVALAAFTAFAFTLLGKMLLAPRVSGYGFYLALPAALVLAAALVWGIPSALRARHGGGSLFRAAALAFFGAAVVYHLRWSDAFYRQETLAVGAGGDTMLTYDPATSPRGPVVAETLRRIETLIAPSQTFTALPEGVMLNYLSRRASTARFTTFMPTEVAVFGEGALVSELAVRPPDFVLLVHKDTREFGVGPFGGATGYGRALLAFVRERYVPLDVIGDPPLAGEGFGIAILRRKAPSA